MFLIFLNTKLHFFFDKSDKKTKKKLKGKEASLAGSLLERWLELRYNEGLFSGFSFLRDFPFFGITVLRDYGIFLFAGLRYYVITVFPFFFVFVIVLV